MMRLFNFLTALMFWTVSVTAQTGPLRLELDRGTIEPLP